MRQRAYLWKAALLVVAALYLPEKAKAQAGVLIPSGAERPDPSILSLDEMKVHITIDNQFARVQVIEIFSNRTDRVQEGRYIFLIPSTASISDFAVWDGDIRIAGVILEKRRAEEIYRDLALQHIDPGLLSQEQETAAFTARVVPIPPHGTKRIELEYSEALPVENLETYFSFPFKPSQYGTQRVGHLEIRLQIASRFPMTDLNLMSKAYQLGFIENSPNYKSASFEASNIELTEDLSFSYGLAVPETSFGFLAYRAPERISPEELRDPRRATDRDGYFEASIILNREGRSPGATQPPEPRSVLILLDTSLSMHGQKLERSYEAVESVLRSLTERDSFNLILFNEEVLALSQAPISASPDQVERALEFIKSSYLMGGTDIGAALERAIRLLGSMPAKHRSMVLITDGNPTLSTTRARTIVERFRRANDSGPRARAYVFGIGSDANLQLLGELARASKGYFDWSRETDDLSFKLKAFTSKIGRQPVDSLMLRSDANLYHVYPNRDVTAYDGTRVSFVGRYRGMGRARMTISGADGGSPFIISEEVQLPERDEAHPHVARLWARARVDALLNQIAIEGETPEAINEVIALSKRYKFVTPYTSFLAAPRSLLRPRVIRPGDPILKVKTDESIVEVTAVFPFGLTKKLHYIREEGLWETRFMAPRELSDGAYRCRLILVDRQGRAYQEEKSFIIDSRPPQLKASLNKGAARPAETLVITVRADSDTRAIWARIFGALPVAVVWDAKARANVGYLRIPAGLPPGTYMIRITAEDFAHNLSTTEVPIQVIGTQ
jgi:Ca-activated chloride channel family protein